MRDSSDSVTYVQITTVCNAQCTMCDSWQLPKCHMPLLEVLKHLDDVSQTDPGSEVRLTGGEPCLHPNYQEIVNGAKERSLSISIITNGSLFQKPLEPGELFRIFLSIDSPRKEDQVHIRKRIIDENLIPQEELIIANVILSSLNKAVAVRIPEWLNQNGVRIINLIPMKSSNLMLMRSELSDLISQVLSECSSHGITHFVEGKDVRGVDPGLVRQALMLENFLKTCEIKKVIRFIDVNGTKHHCNSVSHRGGSHPVTSGLCSDCPTYINGFCDFSNTIYNFLNGGSVQ